MSCLTAIEYELQLEDISKIFHIILDKLDQQPSSLRSRKIKIPIDHKHLPTLYSPKDFNDDKKLEDALTALLSKDIFSIEERQKESFKLFSEKKDAKLVFNYEYEEGLRKFFNRPVLVDKWLNTVNKRSNIEDLKELLFRNKIRISSKTEEEILEKLIILLTSNNSNKSVRHISSKYFWGLSKLLDNKSEIIDYCSLKPSPIILHIKSFNKKFKNILFVENLDTYTQILDSQNSIFNDYLIIYSSGFKAAAKRLRTTQGSKLFFEENCQLDKEGRETLKDWIYDKRQINVNVYFWGDMDYAGINIFSTIKDIFTELEIWKPGYDELLNAIDVKDSHKPLDSDKESQVQPKLTGVQYIDEVLIPILKNEEFVDQEYVNIERVST